MDGEKWNEKDVFLEALALPPGERDAFIQESCPDEASRERIHALLRHHADAPDDLLQVTIRSEDAADTSDMQIDEFRILHRLGEGGMGVVYLAEDTILGRKVALKVLAGHLTGSERALARFREEARNAAALKHPAIVPVYRFGQTDSDQYLVTEFVDGPTLAKVIAERRDALQSAKSLDATAWYRRAAEIAATVADALDCAHRANIVHRDVKPSNILIDREHGPRLADFGIAKHMVEEDRTQTSIMGSCHYMSPEQASVKQERVDQRSDVFSLGVVLYELLTLKRPFDGKDINQILRAVVAQEARPVRKLHPRIPRDLETICHKAIEKEPERRYQTAGHVAADLRSFLTDRPILANPPSIPRRLRRAIRRHRALFLIASVFVSSALSVVVAYLLHTANQQQLAWLSVDSEAENCLVFAQQIDPITLEFAPTSVLELGKTPLNPHPMPVGQYRITVHDQDTDAFLEFNWLARPRKEEPLVQITAYYRKQFPSAQTPDTNQLAGQLLKPSEIDNDNMILVEGGSYQVGWTDAEGPLAKRHNVSVSPFLIDKFEVSNHDYQKFVIATGARPPAIWRAHGYQEDLANMPVVGVTLAEAEAYARWLGKRLPTAFEWQASTRGHEGRDYPWGSNWSSTPTKIGVPLETLELAASWDDTELYECYCRGAQAVDSDDPFRSASGLNYIFGNVREMTATLDADLRDVCLMGRSWTDSPKRTSLGNARFFPSTKTSYFTGFRCARSIRPVGRNAES